MEKTKSIEIRKYSVDGIKSITDIVIKEEPLEIKLSHKGKVHDLAVTMRTPGDDFSLVGGFLFTEGLIHQYRDIAKMSYASKGQPHELQHQSVLVHLHDNVELNIGDLKRHFYSSSSCGVCGKSSVEMISQNGMYILKGLEPLLEEKNLYTLFDQMNRSQSVFTMTGGNHAAGLFNASCQIVDLMEDVGRHNAVDKLIGKALRQQTLPLADSGLIISGRAGFEIVQKAWMAGCPVLVAIGAPSSLAIELANDVGMTLIGFLSASRFNIYSYPERIKVTLAR